jgi:hypothetical protein
MMLIIAHHAHHAERSVSVASVDVSWPSGFITRYHRNYRSMFSALSSPVTPDATTVPSAGRDSV